jgi:hypothetical protein
MTACKSISAVTAKENKLLAKGKVTPNSSSQNLRVGVSAGEKTEHVLALELLKHGRNAVNAPLQDLKDHFLHRSFQNECEYTLDILAFVPAPSEE